MWWRSWGAIVAATAATTCAQQRSGEHGHGRNGVFRPVGLKGMASIDFDIGETIFV
jgi:hypothetical protein